MMQRTHVRRDSTRELARPGPIGLAIRAILGATSIYLVALFTKWNVFVDLDPIESERYYTVFAVAESAVQHHRLRARTWAHELHPRRMPMDVDVPSHSA
jgi:hypothetical protein